MPCQPCMTMIPSYQMFVSPMQAISVAELYGVLDPDTRDWTDGLLSNIFREMNRPLPPDKDEAKYLIFDGDVDAVWVENMNSVMDDNKLLTLPNSERIRLQSHSRLLFEVFDLQYASPATISRCGMVYVDSRNLGYKPYIYTWLNGRTKQGEADILRGLFEKYTVPCIDWILEGVDGEELVRRPKQAIPVTNLNMTTQLCNLLAATITDHPRMGDPQVLEALFVFCTIWSLGELLSTCRLKQNWGMQERQLGYLNGHMSAVLFGSDSDDGKV